MQNKYTNFSVNVEHLDEDRLYFFQEMNLTAAFHQKNSVVSGTTFRRKADNFLSHGYGFEN